MNYRVIVFGVKDTSENIVEFIHKPSGPSSHIFPLGYTGLVPPQSHPRELHYSSGNTAQRKCKSGQNDVKWKYG